MQRIIREVEPSPPSTRLSTQRDIPTIAARREVDPGKLKMLLRGELDWIVMRCLEKDRKRRYQSVGELGDDIGRYLKDEQVQARPATKIYRLKKFVRRNKSSVFAASLVVLALLGGLGLATVGFIRANVERNRTQAALVEAQRQKALADDNFREARGAVEDLLRISDERLKDQPGLQPLRMELMKAAIDRYEPFLSQPMADPTPREELARLYARYGLMIVDQTNVLDQSVMDEFEKARKLQDQLLHEHPGDRSLRVDLGWTLILEEWRNHKFAPLPEQAGRRAVEILKSLVAENPSDPFTRDDLVWALMELAGFVDHAEALSDVNEAVAIGEQLVQKYPASADFRRDLANALDAKTFVLRASDNTPATWAAAMTSCRRSLDLSKAVLADLLANRPEALLPERPKEDEASMVTESPIWAKFDVANFSQESGGIYQLQKDWPDAADMYDQATLYYKELVERSPSVATFNMSLADTFKGRLNAAEHKNDRKSAVAFSKDAVAFWNHLVELYPDQPVLKAYADDAMKSDAEVTQWLAHQSPR
jgi:tetratricopeptide (TPR) repeat protein